MASFEDRMSRLGAEGGVAVTVAHHKDIAADRGAGSADDENTKHAGNPLRTVLVLPVALALGAASVVAGGIAQIHLIDGGVTASTRIPPDLGYIGIFCALVVALLIDRVAPTGRFGLLAVTFGFVAAIYGEGHVAEMYPKLWTAIYEAHYLQPLLATAGL